MSKKDKNEERAQRRKEYLMKYGDDIKNDYLNTISDEKKSKKIWIICGALVLFLIIGGWAVNRHSDDPLESNENQGTFQEEDVNDSDVEINVSQYDLHDKAIVGMWGDETTENFDSLEDFEQGNWVAYKFDEDGFVIMAMGDEGQVFTEHGEWSTSDDGHIAITWSDDNGEVLYSQELEYSVPNESENLFLDGEIYTPITESTIFS